MAAVTFSTGAKHDLRTIGDYIARDNPDRAESFVPELYDACLAIAEFPRSYTPMPRYGPNARRVTHGNYVVMFDVIGNDVRILAIFHAARDF